MEIEHITLEYGCQESLERSIAGLKMMKKVLGTQVKESGLVVGSIIKGNKTELFQTCPSNNLESVDKFCLWLSITFGESKAQRWERKMNLKQRLDENSKIFWSRVIRTVYDTRGKEVPSEISEEDKSEIRFLFGQGLRSDELKRWFKLNTFSVEFEKIPNMVREAELCFPERKTEMVNAIGQLRCWKCGLKGHMRFECPEK